MRFSPVIVNDFIMCNSAWIVAYTRPYRVRVVSSDEVNDLT